MQVFQNKQEGPLVPLWIIEMLETAHPAKEMLNVTSFDDLRYHQGIQHTIEFLRTRSSKPHD